MALCIACGSGSYQEAQRVNLNQKLRPVLRTEFFRFVQKYGLPAKKLKKFFEKSVTFFIFADYICRIVDNKKSLFSHVLSILLHRRLHRTQFCIIIYPEKAGVWQNILPPVPHIHGLKMTTTSLLLCKRSGRGHTLCPLCDITEREINT